MSEMPGLERRYRRLLTWYPAAHRRRHGEEMIDILLASAAGKRRPSLADSLNLAKDGLRVRFRLAAHDGRGAGWTDTFAVASLVIPLTLIISWLVICLLAAAGQAVLLPVRDRQSYLLAFALEAVCLLLSPGPRRALEN
ncbi:MAG: hypothetical protein ACR2FU_06515 [Streptosporangiaceae bacterium]